MTWSIGSRLHVPLVDKSCTAMSALALLSAALASLSAALCALSASPQLSIVLGTIVVLKILTIIKFLCILAKK